MTLICSLSCCDMSKYHQQDVIIYISHISIFPTITSHRVFCEKGMFDRFNKKTKEYTFFHNRGPIFMVFGKFTSSSLLQ